MAAVNTAFSTLTEINTAATMSVGDSVLLKLLVPPTIGKATLKKHEVVYVPKKNFIGTEHFTCSIKTVDGKTDTAIFVISVTENYFKPRARLLLQLGDQLIRNESIALVELAKNSYDADSSYCNITLENVDKPQIGLVTIEDNGWGMDIDIIKNSWLEPGSDAKEKQVAEKIVTPKFKRLPIGEKGIGRFGVHKLGKSIELVSRKKDSNEIVVSIDWEKFSENKYLNQAPISILERKPEVFTGTKTGTKITITKLHKSWTRGMVRDMFRAVNALSTPSTFSINEKGDILDDKKGTFIPNFVVDEKDWISDIPSWEKIKDYALFHFDIEMEGSLITKFKYKFSPWSNLSKVKKRFVTEKDKPVADLLDLIAPSSESRKKFEDVDLSEAKIGTVKFKGSIFIRDKAILKIALSQPTPVSNYLDQNGGIRVYRDGMRIYDYGEPGNDWLELDYRRFNDPSLKVSNNMIIASVNIDRNKSADLIEKTNREGFIESHAYSLFRQAIMHSLRIVEILRRQDKNAIDLQYKNTGFRKLEPVTKTIDDLKKVIGSKIKNLELKKEINLIVSRIEKNYKFMNDTLIKTATVGVGWSIYIHEIDKIILEIEKVIKVPNSQERLTKLITHLAKIIDNYAEILRKSNKKDENPITLIEQALFNIEFRLKAHKIEVVKNYDPAFSKKIYISRSLVVGTIMNIVDNSIYWLERAKVKQKKIALNISLEERGFLSIVISDNGPGFSLSSQEIVEPMVSAKPDGMGLGLHLAKEIMGAHEGKLDFNENGDFTISQEFKKGATVALCFKYKS